MTTEELQSLVEEKDKAIDYWVDKYNKTAGELTNVQSWHDYYKKKLEDNETVMLACKSVAFSGPPASVETIDRKQRGMFQELNEDFDLLEYNRFENLDRFIEYLKTKWILVRRLKK